MEVEKEVKQLKKELTELKNEIERDKEWENYLSKVNHHENMKTLKIIGVIILIAIIIIVLIIFNR